jgi:hypothetical protein
MATWRERGFVPASDGEVSDDNFSTQNNDPIKTAHPGDQNSTVNTSSDWEPGNEHFEGGSGGIETGAEEGALTESAMQQPSISDDGFMDIDDPLGGCTLAKRKKSKEGTPEYICSLDPKDVPVLDLTHQSADVDYEDGGVDLQV